MRRARAWPMQMRTTTAQREAQQKTMLVGRTNHSSPSSENIFSIDAQGLSIALWKPFVSFFALFGLNCVVCMCAELGSMPARSKENSGTRKCETCESE